MIIGKKQSDSLILSLVYNNRELYRLDTKNYTEEISIGRDYACTWSVGQMDQTASSRHAMISFRKGDFYITDLSSRNGIFLNGNQIKESKLCAGFVFRIGECFLNVSKSDVKS